MLGCTGRAPLAGYELQNVTASSPAADAGLAAGDILIKLADQPLAGRADLAPLLQERDAGNELTIDYLRQGKASQTRVKLAPRVP